MKKYIVTIIILFTIIILSIGGYFLYSKAKSNEGNSVDTLKSKCISELEYLNTEIIEIMNGLNNISYENFQITNKEVEVSNEESNTISENSIDSSVVEFQNIITEDKDKVDWQNIRGRVENMYTSWTTILIDLTTLNVNRDNLLKYNQIMDTMIGNLEAEKKEECLKNGADLYSLLVTYIQDISGDSNLISLYKTKSNILYAYSRVDAKDWDSVNNYIQTAISEFGNIMNNQVNNINDIDSINKAYVLINELQQDGINKNGSVFYINYKNLMQELENI